MDMQYVRREISPTVVEDLINFASERGFNGPNCPKAWYDFFTGFGFQPEDIANALQRYQYDKHSALAHVLQDVYMLAKSVCGK